MPDLDQLFDSFVADVRTHSRAPGAATAVKQARRHRMAVSAAVALATVAVIAAGGAVASTTWGDNEGASSLAGPPPGSSELPVSRPDPASDLAFSAEVGKTLTSVPGWSVTDRDPTVLDLCGGDWAAESGGASGGSFPLTPSGERPSVWSDALGFPSAAKASAAVDRLRQNLTACSAVSWQVQSIARTGAVLASSDAAVIWIHQRAATVSTLQVPTTDGPPPLPVQVRIAHLIYAWVG